MKKYMFLGLVGVMMTLGANAQKEWRLDSTIVEDDAQVRLSKIEYEYNSKQQVVVEYETDYEEGEEVTYRTVYTYDNNGQMQLIQMLLDEKVFQKLEVTATDPSTGLPTAYVIWTTDNFKEELAVYCKYEISYKNGLEDKSIFYEWDGLGYNPLYYTVFKYDDKNQVVEEMLILYYEGDEFVYRITTYAYDDHGNVTTEVVEDYMGDLSTTNYTNTYDENGNLKKVRTTAAGASATNELYFWSKFPASGINGVKVKKVLSDWYDLNGKRLNGKPTTKGVFIQNGKKVMISE